MKALRGLVLDIPRQQSVVRDPSDDSMRLLLLKEEVKDGSLPTMSEERRAEIGVDALERTTHDLVLSYDYFNAEQVLRRLLPEGCDVPGSFETVGHIAHLNLRDEVLEHKHVIGRVLLDKNPRLKTVVNKVGSIESEFRVPTWELLAGDTSLETEVRQHGIPFKLDFGEVYWNSRLEAEHKRLIEQIRPGEILCDAMCGIGPFAVPAAKAGRRVYANDLNPSCARYARVNCVGNKVKNLVKCYNMCAREFIRKLLQPGKVEDTGETTVGTDGKRRAVQWAATGEDADGEPPSGAVFDHVTMNLPATAIEFLDVFKGAFDRETWAGHQLPVIHVYTFKRAMETVEDVVRRGEGHLGAAIANPTVHEVRDVAPNKIMLCLSFRITPDAAFPPEDGTKGNEAKRAKTGD